MISHDEAKRIVSKFAHSVLMAEPDDDFVLLDGTNEASDRILYRFIDDVRAREQSDAEKIAALTARVGELVGELAAERDATDRRIKLIEEEEISPLTTRIKELEGGMDDWRHVAESLEAEAAYREESKRGGSWIDKGGSCVCCGGEISQGHAKECDIYKLEAKITALTATIEELEKQAANEKFMRRAGEGGDRLALSAMGILCGRLGRGTESDGDLLRACLGEAKAEQRG